MLCRRRAEAQPEVQPAKRQGAFGGRMMRKYDTILFDLDGTLLDSLEDMKDSVNYVMRQFGFPEHALEEVRSFIGNGIRKLIERSVPAGTDGETCERALAMYRGYYNDHCMIKTHPYEGISELLQNLKSDGYRLAIVSNKNAEAVKLMRQRYFDGVIDVALGQTDNIPKKPDPSMVSAALEALQATPQRAVYVGDSEVDIQTAKNSGLDCITCLWGFRSEEFLMEHAAQKTVRSAQELAEALEALDETV